MSRNFSSIIVIEKLSFFGAGKVLPKRYIVPNGTTRGLGNLVRPNTNIWKIERLWFLFYLELQTVYLDFWNKIKKKLRLYGMKTSLQIINLLWEKHYSSLSYLTINSQYKLKDKKPIQKFLIISMLLDILKQLELNNSNKKLKIQKKM